MRFDAKSFVPWIRAAAPYVHALRGKTVVIAFGGEVVADDTFLGVVHDLNLLHSLGVRLVVVHGSRPQIEAILKQQNIPSRYHRGLRITDAETMDCVLEGMGHARSRIEALLSLGIANSPMAGASAWSAAISSPPNRSAFSTELTWASPAKCGASTPRECASVSMTATCC